MGQRAFRYSFIGAPVLVNIIYYSRTFRSILSEWEIILPVLATSFLDLPVFVLPKLRHSFLRFLHSLLFFALSSSKVLMGMYLMYLAL